MNGEIFRAITKMKEMSNEAVDIITLIDYLKKNGALEKAGGVGYIAGLTESVNVTSNAEQYARIVRPSMPLRIYTRLSMKGRARCSSSRFPVPPERRSIPSTGLFPPSWTES